MHEKIFLRALVILMALYAWAAFAGEMIGK